MKNDQRKIEIFFVTQKHYCCPVKLLLIYKIRADTSHEVSALLVIFVFGKNIIAADCGNHGRPQKASYGDCQAG